MLQQLQRVYERGFFFFLFEALEEVYGKELVLTRTKGEEGIEEGGYKKEDIRRRIGEGVWNRERKREYWGWELWRTKREGRGWDEPSDGFAFVQSSLRVLPSVLGSIFRSSKQRFSSHAAVHVCIVPYARTLCAPRVDSSELWAVFGQIVLWQRLSSSFAPDDVDRRGGSSLPHGSSSWNELSVHHAHWWKEGHFSHSYKTRKGHVDTC
jgi:hypothetical protein